MGEASRRSRGSHRAREPSFSRGRLVARLLVSTVLVWLGWEIISNTAADTFALDQPETALAWKGNHPAALAALAERQLASDSGEVDVPSVVDLAQRALRGDPLEDDALRAMAFAAEMGGDENQARSLMELASSRSSRDLTVQAWLFDNRLRAADYLDALKRVDIMLRVWPDISDYFLPVFAGLAVDPEGRDPLVARLKQRPPWRNWLLSHLPKESEDPKALYPFYADLGTHQSSLTADEVRPYLQRLVEERDYSDAYAMQVEFLPRDRMAMLGLLNDGGFEYPVSGLPFDWTIGNVRGARSEIVADDASNHVLHVEFYNTEVPYRHVSQLLLLRPGEYRLSGKVKSANLQNERGMQWTITCMEGKHQQLAATDRIKGSIPWTTFDTTFEVPDSEDCRAQEIRLVLAARIAAERDVAGEIWYDDLAIESGGDAAASSQSGGNPDLTRAAD